jgi:thiamine biosynthesis protein ThiI
LIGFNKLEVLNLATEIKTHDISILPHDDACSLFAPKNPIIKPSADYWNNWIKEFTFIEELNDALLKTEAYSVNLKGELFKKDHLSFDL